MGSSGSKKKLAEGVKNVVIPKNVPRPPPLSEHVSQPSMKIPHEFYVEPEEKPVIISHPSAQKPKSRISGAKPDIDRIPGRIKMADLQEMNLEYYKNGKTLEELSKEYSIGIKELETMFKYTKSPDVIVGEKGELEGFWNGPEGSKMLGQK